MVPRKRTLTPPAPRDPDVNVGGRPTREQAEAKALELVLDLVSDGMPLKNACIQAKIERLWFRKQVRVNADLRKAWREAQVDQSHALFDDMNQLQRKLQDTEFKPGDNAQVTAKRVALEALKHITSKLNVNDYGEQKPGNKALVVNIITDLSLAGKVPDQPVDTKFEIVGHLPQLEDHSDG